MIFLMCYGGMSSFFISTNPNLRLSPYVKAASICMPSLPTWPQPRQNLEGDCNRYVTAAASSMILPQGIKTNLNTQDMRLPLFFILKINRNRWWTPSLGDLGALLSLSSLSFNCKDQHPACKAWDFAKHGSAPLLWFLRSTDSTTHLHMSTHAGIDRPTSSLSGLVHQAADLRHASIVGLRPPVATIEGCNSAQLQPPHRLSVLYPGLWYTGHKNDRPRLSQRLTVLLEQRESRWIEGHERS